MQIGVLIRAGLMKPLSQRCNRRRTRICLVPDPHRMGIATFAMRVVIIGSALAWRRPLHHCLVIWLLPGPSEGGIKGSNST